ncbi:MAG TPA: proteasome assembly chaperone family protein [Candidatus Nitrosotenuis sp.]|nr:proteasome assembly chaperone family protein [Candidatus Nitrosotenuis sp.]HIH45524.1 proteasome assembly chaperone family protein [Candidatus Nitrosotenuis sp.]HII03638.1 proteasome assembly chaperone family protein [Candidatus Nitrosotenuis sp.]
MTRKISDESVYEIKKILLKSPIVIAGFVGPGLAGPLAVGYIIEKLNMQEIGYLHSKYLPPSTVFIQGRLRHPFRVYSNKKGNICAIICEVTLRADGLYNIASILLDWAQTKGCKELVILDGVASEEHDNQTFCAAEEDLCRIMQDKQISMISQGFITGIPGSILNECIIRKIRAITLLVKASNTKPDPLAAATLIDSLCRVYGFAVDTSELRQQREKIGSDFKELSEKYKEHRQADSGMYM